MSSWRVGFYAIAAAENGHVKAMYFTGMIYFHGKGVTQDFNKAVERYQKSAQQGYLQAQFQFGMMNYYGSLRLKNKVLHVGER